MGKSKENHLAKISDEQIIDLYCDRNENAILETDAKYGNMLFTIAYNMLYDPLDCEECKNDTYLGVWNAIPPSRPTKLSVFLSKIMRNIATNRYKERIRQKRIPSELTVSMEELHEILVSTNTPEAAYTAKELGNLISDFIRGLTERQRFIFFSRFYLSETIEDISKECGVARATVYREIEVIKQGLRIQLERNGMHQ